MLDREALGQVERWQAAALRLVGQNTAAAARILSAPPGYLLVHDSSDIARHCDLLSPLPAAGDARVIATPGRSPGEWQLDVAARDRPGLLASFTAVLARGGVDVVQAVLATWSDGGALQAYRVKSGCPPDPARLQDALVRSRDEPLSAAPVGDAQLSFRDDRSPLFTCCDVQVADRPGLLHALAVAFATAGADVHAARVTTRAGMAHDRFDLSDGAGHKLDEAVKDAIRGLVAAGVAPRHRSWRRTTRASRLLTSSP